MPWNIFRRRHKRDALGQSGAQITPRTGVTPPAQDTKAAIDELSQAVKNNPEAVEIYLALGNLYRSQGEIERSIQIRKSLIVRPDLDNDFKARASYELGRDFRRAGILDRAGAALEKAAALIGPNPAIILEMAKLAAQGGDFSRAAKLYSDLNWPVAEAHYLVRRAGELFTENDAEKGLKTLKKALRVWPESVEAWLGQLIQTSRSAGLNELKEVLGEALAKVERNLRFVLLEGYLESMFIEKRRILLKEGLPPDPRTRLSIDVDVAEAVVSVIERQAPDVLLSYYAGKVLLFCDRPDAARPWLDKALILRPGFWLARLELFSLDREAQTLSPAFKEHLDFFLEQARKVRRFVCTSCGLKRDAIFFVCPRCQGWHTIAFRLEFTQ
ncbi:MAG: tetratricopeptide repeat protein [Desulfovibrionaceae bacterium]|nr:tetratricopeptide repeat protein [Desulfovibrionaceae bacterium]MDD4953224.1 tetratricopeptide repeat protein [Desulfovibrionaceae bacterium]